MMNNSEKIFCYEEFVEPDFIWKSYDFTEVTVHIPEKCKHCSSNMLKFNEPWWVVACKNPLCGWWLHTPPPEPSGFRSLVNKGKWSIIKEFFVNDSELSVQHVKRYLRDNPEKIPNVSSKAFEKLMLSLIKDFYDPVEIVHVGKPRDGGKDLYGILTNGETFFVEVKRRQNLDVAESIDTVRRLLGVMVRDGIRKGIVVSSSKRFSPDAHKFAYPSDLSIVNYEIDLVSFSDISTWLKLKENEDTKPWERLVEPLYVDKDFQVFISGI